MDKSINKIANEIIANATEEDIARWKEMLGIHDRISINTFERLCPQPSKKSCNLAEDIALLSNGYTFYEIYEEEEGIPSDDWGDDYGYDNTFNNFSSSFINQYVEQVDCSDSDRFEEDGIELTLEECDIINYQVSEILENAIKIINEFFITNEAGYLEQKGWYYPHSFLRISTNALAYAIQNFNLNLPDNKISEIHAIANKIRDAYYHD